MEPPRGGEERLKLLKTSTLYGHFIVKPVKYADGVLLETDFNDFSVALSCEEALSLANALHAILSELRAEKLKDIGCTADALDSYMPGSCPICGYLGIVREFAQTAENVVRLECPICNAMTRYRPTLNDALSDWVDGKVEESGEADGDA